MLLNQYTDRINDMGLLCKDGKLIPIEVAALGLIGEVGELLDATAIAVKGARDEDDARKKRREVLLEAGDVLWYVNAIAVAHLGVSLVDLDAFNVRANDYELTLPTARVCDMIKKHVWHGKDLNTLHVMRDLAMILGGVRYILDHFRPQPMVLEDAAEANVEKLSKRYPKGFVEGGGIRTN